MAPVKIAARDIIIQVLDPSALPETWVQLHQLTSATINKGENEETAETTTFDSDGNYEQLIMQRGATMELEGFLRKDSVTGARDAGQKLVDELADKTSVESLARVRHRHPMDPEWQVWDATVSGGEEGGEVNDMTSWEAVFTRSGPKSSAVIV